MVEIILFGFSGSGKSTMATLIGKKYGLQVIHPSGVLKSLYEKTEIDIKNAPHNTGFWESEKGAEVFEKRLSTEKPLDIFLDEMLLKELKKGRVIIDSWTLPWLSKTGYKIYLKADENTRAQRVSKRNRIDVKTAKEAISTKDENTRRLFQKLYGFDIKKDHEVFDYVLDTGPLTQEEVASKIYSGLPF